MEAALTAAAAFRGRSLVRPPVAYGCAREPRRVVGSGLGRRRRLVTVAALPEPLEPVPSPAQEGAVSPAPEADDEEELEVHGDAADAESSSPSSTPGKTVRVRFVLPKECPFGQSFHLVGDDPALGLWDPEESVALQWAEGHVWVAEKDLPANKLIEFKFLLRDTSGTFQWQDGPNRRLQTCEAASTLVVYEDWSDVKNQKIEEEGNTSIGIGDAVVSDEKESKKDSVVEDELQMDDNKEVEQDESVVAEKDEKSAFATNDSDQGDSVIKAYKADPPKPFPREELKMQGQLNKEKENGCTPFADESYAEKTAEENITSEDGAPVENGLTNAYEHDFLWGWKALQQLLMNLGFKMDTS
ncbi:hypothetical protein PR202_gb01402 [Eleusine coracana subsp. coracana]|uniref:CBM20 domain-containing protein n=1 Tax=Eleusine coracana subsp. coracana TaxID=191504 RepID=A0AAV5DV20_ELECO|nr:hypothetical protein QOZ80_5BG0418740 [Eleusine coracana subsp. coracana]GJN14559.1 hypothetical protein PR202_gb01402 [Eleusine coracana subsp. coracana]